MIQGAPKISFTEPWTLVIRNKKTSAYNPSPMQVTISEVKDDGTETKLTGPLTLIGDPPIDYGRIKQALDDIFAIKAKNFHGTCGAPHRLPDAAPLPGKDFYA